MAGSTKTFDVRWWDEEEGNYRTYARRKSLGAAIRVHKRDVASGRLSRWIED